MKKFLSLLLTVAVVLGVLSGCGSKEESASEAAKSVETESIETESEAVEPVEAKGTITVAASATPHAEILEQAKPLLAAEGWEHPSGD